MGGGGSQTRERQNTARRIPGLLKPYVKDLLGNAQTAYNQVSQDPFQGNFLAPVQQNEFTAQQQAGQVGANLGTTAGQGLFDLGQKTASGAFLTPNSNPYLMPYIQNLTDETLRAYDQTRKGVTSNSIAQGAYGGDRGQLAQSDLASQTNRAISDATTNLLYQNYLQERQNQQNAGQLIQQGVGLNLLGPQILGESGAATRNLNQVALDEALAQFNEKNTAPFRGLDQYANIVYGAPSTYINSDVAAKSRTGSTGNWTDSVLGIIQSLLGAGGSLMGG